MEKVTKEQIQDLQTKLLPYKQRLVNGVLLSPLEQFMLTREPQILRMRESSISINDPTSYDYWNRIEETRKWYANRNSAPIDYRSMRPDGLIKKMPLPVVQDEFSEIPF